MIMGFISKLVRTITLSKVLIWSLTALLCISLYTVYENRSKLVAWFTAPELSNMVGITFTVGPDTQTRLIELVNKNSNIMGVAVMSADLRLNEARSMYFFAGDPVLTELVDRSNQMDSNRLPLFTSIDENNIEIIKLINGQFSCIAFNQTLEAKIYPQLAKSVRSVCRSSIPSYYGYFSGYLQIYLREEPNSEKQLQLKLIVEKLANDIYFKDVLPTQRPEKTNTSKSLGI